MQKTSIGCSKSDKGQISVLLNFIVLFTAIQGPQETRTSTHMGIIY